MKQELRIKEICREKNITLSELAHKLGILRTSLSQALMRNSFSTDRLKDIATALDVPLWQLFASPTEISQVTGIKFTALIKDGDKLYKADSWLELKKLVESVGVLD